MENRLLNIITEQNLLYLGCTDLQPLERYEAFQQWLSKGHHGAMSYLENYPELRQSPALVMEPSAVSALIVALPYKCADTKLFSEKPQIAQYARFSDYHKVLKKKAQLVADAFLKELSLPSSSARVCVDTAPILERAVAELAGKGFIGKNTCLIHPEKGSMFCLGVIFFSVSILSIPLKSSLHFPEPSSEKTSCGTCKRCQVHCPTGALDGQYRMDASKCLSYWTIEHRGTIPKKYWSYFKTFWYGCDICQMVCPFNRKTEASREVPLEQLNHLDLFQVATMDQSFYTKTFGGTAMTRAKIHGLKRNALIALWASKDSRLVDALAYVREKDVPVSAPDVAQMLLDTCDQLSG